MPHRPATLLSESRLSLIVGLIQFINILDFMMVMPLGPDFAAALAMPAEHIGIIGGSYTLAAALTGLFASLYLDRFDRKKAMLFCLFGLAVATALGAAAWNTDSLLAARVVAGMFGGPLSSLAVAMIADFVPPERRGVAMGKVLGAFAVASVLGVPFGLELAQHMGWRAPFLALGLIALVVWGMGLKFLPGNSNVRDETHVRARFMRLLGCFKSPVALASFTYTALAMMSSFLIVPNISAHVQMNMDYPRSQLGVLYLVGGMVSFFAMRSVGKLIDRTSSTLVSAMSTSVFIASIAVGFVWFDNAVPVLVVFVCFMLGSATRSVSAQTLSSKVPAPHERGGFMSLLSSITHLGTSAGAFISSHMLMHTEDGKLAGIENVGMLAIALSATVPFLFYYTEKRVRMRKDAVPIIVVPE